MSGLTGQSIGDYYLDQALPGGNAYSARQWSTGRQVELRLLEPAQASGADAWSRLSHYAIHPVIEAGRFEGRQYLVVPEAAGGTLAGQLRGGLVALDYATGVIHNLGQALEYAHSQGVLHGNVRPESVYINADLSAALADFGFPSSPDNPYLAPEIRSGQPATRATDVYGLAAVLYAMLTGGPPQWANGKLVPVGKFQPGIPKGVERALEQALAQDPALRPPVAVAFAAAIYLTVNPKADYKLMVPPAQWPYLPSPPRRTSGCLIAGILALIGVALVAALVVAVLLAGPNLRTTLERMRGGGASPVPAATATLPPPTFTLAPTTGPTVLVVTNTPAPPTETAAATETPRPTETAAVTATATRTPPPTITRGPSPTTAPTQVTQGAPLVINRYVYQGAQRDASRPNGAIAYFWLDHSGGVEPYGYFSEGVGGNSNPVAVITSCGASVTATIGVTSDDGQSASTPVFANVQCPP